LKTVRTMVELKFYLFKTIYLSPAALDYQLLDFHDFLDLFSF